MYKCVYTPMSIHASDTNSDPEYFHYKNGQWSNEINTEDILVHFS